MSISQYQNTDHNTLFLGDKILQTGKVLDEEGNYLNLKDETSKEQCLFLQNIVRDIKPTIAVEIGLAFGLSALYICQALQDIGGQKLIAMDPNQFADGYRGVGVLNIERAGFGDLFSFYEERSQYVLPRLYRDGLRIQFAYVDTVKHMDAVLVDAYFLTRLMDIGGVVVFDDCTFTGLNKMIRYLAKHPSFEVYDRFISYSEGRGRRLLHLISRFIPRAEKIFHPRVIETDADLGVNAHCIALRKIKEDSRRPTDV